MGKQSANRALKKPSDDNARREALTLACAQVTLEQSLDGDRLIRNEWRKVEKTRRYISTMNLRRVGGSQRVLKIKKWVFLAKIRVAGNDSRGYNDSHERQEKEIKKRKWEFPQYELVTEYIPPIMLVLTRFQLISTSLLLLGSFCWLRASRPWHFLFTRIDMFNHSSSSPSGTAMAAQVRQLRILLRLHVHSALEASKCQ